MKKLIIAAITFLCFSVAGFSQTTTPVQKKVVKAQTSKKADKAPIEQGVTKPAKSNTTSAVATKQDLKKPVVQTPAATPVKKDGTPDKRFKANKAVAAAPATTSHLKKDGTPDKRFKENKKHS